MAAADHLGAADQQPRVDAQGPAEQDMAQYFQVTPTAVHAMIDKLEQLGLVTREPASPRSIRVAIPEQDVPALDPVAGPQWA